MRRPNPSSRENGRLSHGPVTQAGKDRAKYNAVRHGLLARRAVVLEGESQQEYDRLAGAQYQRFQPKDEVEAEIVDEMAAVKWRIRRLEAIETCLMNEVIQQSAAGDPEAGITAAFRSLAENKALALLLRYDSHLKLAYQRAMRNLIQLQNAVPLPEPEAELEAVPQPQPLVQRAAAAAAAATPNEPVFMDPLRSFMSPETAAANIFAASSPVPPL